MHVLRLKLIYNSDFFCFTASILNCHSWVASEEDLKTKIWAISICLSIQSLLAKEKPNYCRRRLELFPMVYRTTTSRALQ